MTHGKQKSVAAGGCDFAVSPELSALTAIVYWATEVSAPDLNFVPSQPYNTDFTVKFEHRVALPGEDRILAMVGQGPYRIRVSVVGPTSANRSVAILLPLDADFPERLASLHKLWCLLIERPMLDTRLTAQKRQRLKQMIRAFDGKSEGASTKDIATALYGLKRVKSELWSSSALRYSILRLLRDGEKLVDGGYRDLLCTPMADTRRNLNTPVRK